MESYSYADAVLSTHKQQHCLPVGSEKKPAFLNLSVSKIEKQINDKFPLPELKQVNDNSGSFWFSNEFPAPEELDFKKTIQELSKLSTGLRSRRVSIITGEGCLLSCLPELAKICSIVFQVDHDPKLLHLSQLLITNLATVDVEKEVFWLDHSIMKLKNEIIGFHPAREKEIYTQYNENKKRMRQFHCFSSEQRLIETKKACSLCKVIPVYADFFVQNDMSELAKIVKDNNVEVVFINLSNVMEYFQEFYTQNKFSGIVTGIDPSCHVRSIPLSESTLCAFSSLRIAPLFSRVCNKEKYRDELYLLAQKNSKDVIKQLATRSSSMISTTLPSEACLVLAKTAYPYSLSQASLRLLLSRLKYFEALELQKQRPSIEEALKHNQCIKEDDTVEFLAIIDTAITEQFAANKKFQRTAFGSR